MLTQGSYFSFFLSSYKICCNFNSYNSFPSFSFGKFGDYIEMSVTREHLYLINFLLLEPTLDPNQHDAQVLYSLTVLLLSKVSLCSLACIILFHIGGENDTMLMMHRVPVFPLEVDVFTMDFKSKINLKVKTWR